MRELNFCRMHFLIPNYVSWCRDTVSSLNIWGLVEEALKKAEGSSGALHSLLASSTNPKCQASQQNLPINNCALSTLSTWTAWIWISSPLFLCTLTAANEDVSDIFLLLIPNANQAFLKKLKWFPHKPCFFSVIDSNILRISWWRILYLGETVSFKVAFKFIREVLVLNQLGSSFKSSSADSFIYLSAFCWKVYGE